MKFATLLLFLLTSFGIFASNTPITNFVENAKVMATELTHWLTSSSGVRHNNTCRWYKNSKGRLCEPDEGRACKVCGG